jgi:hypothetical protein
MATPWNVLIVDDEEDVHGITNIALKRKNWRGRPIALKSARSGKEAREILQSGDAPNFHCALVDVVMETNDAGLQLCDFVRSNMPRTMRLILRTGQPGAAPPEKVLNDYDIDYYLAKTEVTEERLFSVLRACFRSSLDISALIAVGTQLRAFTTILQNPTATREGLVAIMLDSIRFLEEKYSAKIAFVPDVQDRSAALPTADAGKVTEALVSAHKQQRAPMKLHPGAEFGLPDGAFVLVTTALNPMARAEKGVGERMKNWFKGIMGEGEEKGALAGLAIQFEKEVLERVRTEFAQDVELFLTNWRVADSSFRLQDKMVRDRMEMMKQHGQGV